MSAKPLLVGEANPYSRDPEMALFPWPPGSAGGRLCHPLGWGRSHYLRAFDRVNLYLNPPLRWSAPEARLRAGRIMEGRCGQVVLLGVRVMHAFRPWTKSGSFWMIPWTRRGRFLYLPHPSGLSRAWNAPGSAERLREALDPYFPAGDPETAAEARGREAWARERW